MRAHDRYATDERGKFVSEYRFTGQDGQVAFARLVEHVRLPGEGWRYQRLQVETAEPGPLNLRRVRGFIEFFAIPPRGTWLAKGSTHDRMEEAVFAAIG